MRRKDRIVRLGLPTLLGVALASTGAAAQNGNPWSAIALPSNGAPRAIGTYANGCIQGAVSLPLDGPGWHVIRPQRNRNWGHPRLIAAIQSIARQVLAETGKSLLVADIAQPRGGPASGHASHQIGLDADIRFQLVARGGPDATLRHEGTETSMVTADAKEIDRTRWGRDQLAMLRIAAELPGMDRIFVNPVIKREACAAASGERRWLARVVPWYGHDGHMHVRLACPPDSPDCRGPEPTTAGDGCGGELAWWFTTEPFKRNFSRPARPPEPPAACAALLPR
jgi:penicillin-insensitive murein endopeptidase